MVKNRETWYAAMGLQTVRHNWATEQQRIHQSHLDPELNNQTNSSTGSWKTESTPRWPWVMDLFSPFQLTIESPFPHSQLSVLIYTVKPIDQNNKLFPTLTPLSHIHVHTCKTMKISTSYVLKNGFRWLQTRETWYLTANSVSGSSVSHQRTLQGQLQNLKRSILAMLNKCQLWGLPWWFSGQDCTLPMQGVWVQSLVRELASTCPN